LNTIFARSDNQGENCPKFRVAHFYANHSKNRPKTIFLKVENFQLSEFL
jgi:hypothetical protein